jgi:phosphatidylserine decarboxylase
VAIVFQVHDTAMKLRTAIANILQQEDINFLLTNRIPRLWLTRFIGWFSRIERRWVCEASIAVWRIFVDLDLRESRSTRFKSLHDCFTRELMEGARPVDADDSVVTSPCDAIVGAIGSVADGSVLQAKGYPYKLIDLLGDADLVRYYLQGSYATLRLTAGMYHRFHAPYDCRIEQVTYVSGDTWNVNPIALKRIESLFCKNERAIIRCRLKSTGDLITLAPVAAILVGSIRLHFLDVLLHLKYRGPNVIHCNAVLRKGQEMGWFQHGSTILVFAPDGFSFCDGVRGGSVLRMGQPLFRRCGQLEMGSQSNATQ